MLIKNQLIEIQISSSNINHFTHLGYDVKRGQTIMVPPEDLTESCHKKVDVICDICGKKVKKEYVNYLNGRTYDIDCCVECRQIKNRMTNQQKYGTDYPLQNKDIMKKAKQTNIVKYGVENPSSSQLIKDKRKCTYLERYGVEYISQSDICKQKNKQTILQKYGVEYISQSDDIKKKVRETFYKNGTAPISRPQEQLYNMVKNKYLDAKLNYPFDDCSLDIFLYVDDIKIDIEYDGWYWHQNKQRDTRRDNYLIRKGFKILRIRSGELLPTADELFSAIDCLVNTEHHFKEIKLSDWKEVDKEVADNGE